MRIENLVGNDVVDLKLLENRGKAYTPRFLERVLVREESAAVETSSDPDRTLWAFWTAKEAAFKILCRISPGTVFSPRQFVVQTDRQCSENAIVRFGDKTVYVRWVQTAEYLHCLAKFDTDFGRVSSEVARLDHLPEPELTEAELLTAKREESRKCRFLAKKLYEGTYSGFNCVEIIRQECEGKLGAPFYKIDGVPTDCGLSLSHDGAWAAAATVIP